jgi:prepilin-type N-terminal cleavage/methylation domain-containing protein
MQILVTSRRFLKRGFTLIEIMVATTIMVVLVGLVIQITSEVLSVWNRSSGRLSANAQARIAMELITQDLESAVFRKNGMQWLRAEDETINGPAGSTVATVSLKLFSPALDREEGPGELCGIAYKLEYANPIDGSLGAGTTDNRLFILYRLVVSPESTFEDLLGEPNQLELPGSEAIAWGTNPPNDIIGDEGGNYLVSNIVEFEIDFYVEEDEVSGDTLAPSPVIYGGTDSTIGSDAVNAFQERYRKPLSYAVIRLTVISDEGAQQLQNIDRIQGAGSNQDKVEDIITTFGETFVRRIPFLSKPL